MDIICPITGKKPCHCHRDVSRSHLGNAYLLDLKAALRSVFTDHVVYTNWLIVESLPELRDAAPSVTTRLLKNPTDIRNILEPMVGVESGEIIERLFNEHLLLAAAALEHVRSGNKRMIKQSVEAFYKQGNAVGEALHSLNIEKLDLDYAKSMMKQHNEFVVKLAMLRQQQKYEKYIETYDMYYRHILLFSDMIYETLTP